jgi:hypothetical protein
MEIGQEKRSHRKDRERDGKKTLKWILGIHVTSLRGGTCPGSCSASDFVINRVELSYTVVDK